MNNISYLIRMIMKVFSVLLRRMIGRKQHENWSLQTELIWATTRLTILSSKQYGLSWYQKLGQRYKPKPKLGKQVKISTRKYGEANCLEILPQNSSAKIETVIVYFHGGGFVSGSPDTSIEFLTRLALKTQSLVVAPYYPLAPVHTYPAAHVFAIQAVEEILHAYRHSGFYLGGDSAGATLVLSTMKNLNPKAWKPIEGCILISPWVEPLADGGSIAENAQSDVGNRAFLLACYQAYLTEKGLESTYPMTFTEDNLLQLPATLISIGEAEMLWDQSHTLAENLKNKGTKVDLLSYTAMFHTFWNLAPNIKEAETLIEDIASWMKKPL